VGFNDPGRLGDFHILLDGFHLILHVSHAISNLDSLANFVIRVLLGLLF
jgi:hypothetical protein